MAYTPGSRVICLTAFGGASRAARCERFDAYRDGVADEFLEGLGAGRSQPGHIVRLAKALHDKHPDDPVYAWWARLGGISFKNVERDLRRRMKNLWDNHVEPFYIPITLASADGQTGERHQLATLAPYELFSAIYECGVPFASTFLGDDGPEGAWNYWTELAGKLTVNLRGGCGATEPDTKPWNLVVAPADFAGSVSS